jgi:hypothetical protein
MPLARVPSYLRALEWVAAWVIIAVVLAVFVPAAIPSVPHRPAAPDAFRGPPAGAAPSVSAYPLPATSVHPDSRPSPTGANTTTNIAYGNRTIVIPDWNTLAAYAWNCNSNVSTSTGADCFATGRLHLGYEGMQVPLLSWTANGVFYVNASFDLDFYSFDTGAVSRIAPWLPLYDNVMWYAGVTNTEFITTDGSYVYEFGCLTPACEGSSGSNVTTYAVNVSTGRTFEHNWTRTVLTAADAPEYSTYLNSQVNMVGIDGNDSILTLTVGWSGGHGARTNGTILAYNIWTGEEWKLAEIPYFEANNLYWIPEFSQFFDVSADDSTYDAVYQVLLSGPASHPVASGLGPFAYENPALYGIGGVGGLAVNVLQREVAFSSDWQGEGSQFGVVAQLNGSGDLSSYAHVDGPFVGGTDPATLAGEHRSTTLTGGYTFVSTPPGQPDTWLAVPSSNGTFASTNVSQSFQAWNLDGGLFYDTNYSILTGSDQCNRVSTTGTDCALAGTLPGASPGTLWWAWRLGLPEFPFPRAAPLAEPDPPFPVDVVPFAVSGGVRLSWTVPASDVDPIVNYTVAWGPSPGQESDRTSLNGSAQGFTILNQTTGVPVFYTVLAWNLHGPAETTGSFTPTLGSPPAAPVLRAVVSPEAKSPGFSNVTVEIDEGSPGSGPIRNDTLWWGSTPGVYPYTEDARALGLPAGSGAWNWTIPNLLDGRTYYFVAESWNGWGESSPSSVLAVPLPSSSPPSCPPDCPNPASGSFPADTIEPVAASAIVLAAVSVVVVVVYGRKDDVPRDPR